MENNEIKRPPTHEEEKANLAKIMTIDDLFGVHLDLRDIVKMYNERHKELIALADRIEKIQSELLERFLKREDRVNDILDKFNDLAIALENDKLRIVPSSD
jgi:hypothetical protein